MRVPKAVVAAFVFLAILLIGTNAALVKKDRALATQNKSYLGSLQLNVGDNVPPLSGNAPDGSAITVAYNPGKPKTLLLVYARSCPECALNWAAWQKILRKIDPTETRPVAVSVESSGMGSRYIEQAGLTNVRTVLLPDFPSIISYRFRYTPQTVLIDPQGRVEGIWSGALNSKQITDVEQAALSSEPTSSVAEKTAPSR